MENIGGSSKGGSLVGKKRSHKLLKDGQTFLFRIPTQVRE